MTTHTIDQLGLEIRQLITNKISRNRDVAALTGHDDLLSILNSLQLLRLVLALESQYGVSIDTAELTPENFGTIERVSGFVASKLK